MLVTPTLRQRKNRPLLAEFGPKRPLRLRSGPLQHDQSGQPEELQGKEINFDLKQTKKTNFRPKIFYFST